MNSWFAAFSGGRFVTVWPCVTGEHQWFDVATGTTGDDVRKMTRVTATEAAAVIITELGAPVGESLEKMARQIAGWRTEYDAYVLNNPSL